MIETQERDQNSHIVLRCGDILTAKYACVNSAMWAMIMWLCNSFNEFNLVDIVFTNFVKFICKF